MRFDEPYLEELLRWHLYRRWRNDLGRRSYHEFRQRIRRAPPGALALDCGANVGDVTGLLVKDGYRVIAFEPEEIALVELRRRFGAHERVTIVPKAIGGTTRRATLYREVKAGTVYTEASSVLPMNHHSAGAAYDVEVVGILDVLAELGEPVDVMKVDIEGAEAELLEAILDAGAQQRIEQIYVETHERLDAGIARRLAAIRSRLAETGVTNIDLGWG